MPQLKIDEQVALLMQGTEYGDSAVQNAMALELRQRLEEAHAAGRPLRVYGGSDPRIRTQRRCAAEYRQACWKTWLLRIKGFQLHRHARRLERWPAPARSFVG